MGFFLWWGIRDHFYLYLRRWRKEYSQLTVFLSTSSYFPLFFLVCPVGWDRRIYRLHLCRGVRPSPNDCPRYYTKQSDGEATVMLGLRGIRITSSLPLLPGPLWRGVAAPDTTLSMGQIELNCILILNWITWNRTVLTFNCVFTLNWIVWNRTVWQKRIAWNRNVFDN